MRNAFLQVKEEYNLIHVGFREILCKPFTHIIRDYNQIKSHFRRSVYALGSCVTLIILFGTCVILFTMLRN